MGRVVHFCVPGECQPWARPGARIAGSCQRRKHWISWYTEDSVDAQEQAIMDAFRRATDEPFPKGPLEIQYLVVEPRLQRQFRLKDPPGFVPSMSPKDVDNLGKVVFDALQRCATCLGSRAGKGCGCPAPRALVDDDKRASHISGDKVRAEIALRRTKRGANPRLYVRVAELDQETQAERIARLFPGAEYDTTHF